MILAGIEVRWLLAGACAVLALGFLVDAWITGRSWRGRGRK